MHVDDAIALTDGAREVKLYHVPNNHSSGMLVGYVPDARVLFTADLVSDTFPLIPVFASTVHELIQENGLSVEMIAFGHGNVMPLCSACLCTREVSGHGHETLGRLFAVVEKGMIAFSGMAKAMRDTRD
jgi:glyoxylase-like metal-dependent hydrolase (beta-lactamase superfamily II)